MSEIRFSSTEDALQYLSDYTESRIIIAGVADVLLQKQKKNNPGLTVEHIKSLIALTKKIISSGVEYDNSKIDIHGKQIDTITKLAINLVLSGFNDLSSKDMEEQIKKGSYLFKTLEKCVITIATLLYLRQRYPQYKDEEMLKWVKKDINNFKDYEALKRHFNIHKDLLVKDDNGFISFAPIKKSDGKANISVDSLPTEATISGYIIKKIDSKDQIPTQEWTDLECGAENKYCITTKNFFGQYGGPPYFWVLKPSGDKYIQKGMIIPSYFDEDAEQALRNETNDDMMSEELIKELMPFLKKHGIEKIGLNGAIKTKDKELIKMIIDAGDKPNEYNLHYAIAIKDKEIVKMIIDLGAKPNESNLNNAIATKDKELIDMVIDAGAKPNKSNLNYAIETKNKEIIDMVIDAGAKPNKYSLNSAIETKDKEIIDMVIDAGAKPNEYSLNSALKTKDKEIIDMVIDLGAKPNELSLNYAIVTKDKEIIDMVKKLLQKKAASIQESVLRFGSKGDAIQHLSDYTESRIIIATEEETETQQKKEKEQIERGMTSGKSIQTIANKHGVSPKLIQKQIQKGIKVEMEHTEDLALAREIAMDHLMESPVYYDKLEEIESKMEVEMEKNDEKNS